MVVSALQQQQQCKEPVLRLKKKNKNGTYAVTSPKITAYKSLHFKCDQGRCKESDGDTDKMSKLLWAFHAQYTLT